MTCHGTDYRAMQGLVLLDFSKLVNGILSDFGGMFIKVTLLAISFSMPFKPGHYFL